MKGRKNIFIKFFPGRKNVSKFFICSYFLAFGLAENPIKADGPVLDAFISTTGETCEDGNNGSRGANMGSSGSNFGGGPTYTSQGRRVGDCLDVAITNIGIIDIGEIPSLQALLKVL